MCGRYTLTKDLEVLEIRFGFSAPESSLSPRFNVAPMQYCPVVLLEDGRRVLRMMRWGLVPFWAKDESIAGRLINARSETIADKPSFRQALQQRRCLVPADGFYEWAKRGKDKQPIYFQVLEGRPFALAGIYERRSRDEGDELYTFTIITTGPNELVKPVHDRMPVILDERDEERWLDPATPLDELLKLLDSYPAGEMSSREVSGLVNSPRNDGPDLLEPPAAAPALNP